MYVDEMERPWRRTPMVYFIAAVGANAIKIGYTTHLDVRLSELATGCPFELIPVGAIFAEADAELIAHAVLKAYRIRGEWFEDCPAVWDYLDTHGHYVFERWNRERPLFVPFTNSGNELAYDDDSPHRAVVASNVRDAFNRAPLNSRERQVIAMRFGLDDQKELTLAEIGAALRVSGERIRQIERSGLRKLKRFV